MKNFLLGVSVILALIACGNLAVQLQIGSNHDAGVAGLLMLEPLFFLHAILWSSK
ncbi:hypothetical protein UFOVP1516_50 [uncultured Caudovirales phage]|uniref:Lipoprotein n=1 Tax=uncultured Caudovirales phage TaxID=2100421 RepID=A0A6J5PNZ7_9CAUD|nr:hypothetical protein UFOVP887_85 [uncultured Caudovirales phage]CAB5226885.1 hypothetical protein UFOVP1516_50 [uncultured Caudovirales phage]